MHELDKRVLNLPTFSRMPPTMACVKGNRTPPSCSRLLFRCQTGKELLGLSDHEVHCVRAFLHCEHQSSSPQLLLCVCDAGFQGTAIASWSGDFATVTPAPNAKSSCVETSSSCQSTTRLCVQVLSLGGLNWRLRGWFQCARRYRGGWLICLGCAPDQDPLRQDTACAVPWV